MYVETYWLVYLLNLAWVFNCSDL